MSVPAPAPTPSPPSLEGLADIVLPSPVSFVPRTLGWYLVLALFLALVAAAVLHFRRRRAANLYRRQALAELEAIVVRLGEKGGRQELAARLPELLKRVALHVEPRAEVASLVEDDWLALLDGMHRGEAFREGPGQILPRLAYGSHAFVFSVPRADIDALVRLSREWIRKHHALPMSETSGSPGDGGETTA
jgi:Domain of unknown function (DUF4381)